MTAALVLAAATARGWRIATAESCTGGMVAAALTDIPGSSGAFDWGVVTYSNAAKVQLLGVAEATLDAHGAVSEQVAGEMAEGARARSGADLAISITGIAGPGGSEHKPEGRVCFGVSMGAGTRTETVEFGPRGRAQVRKASVVHALRMALRALR